HLPKMLFLIIDLGDYSHINTKSFSLCIAGVDKGILAMSVNECRRITKVSFFCAVSGDKVPSDTTLVFDLVLLNILNRADQVQTKVISTPKECKRSVMRIDFVRFHFYGTLLDSTVFDSMLIRNHTDYETPQDVVLGGCKIIDGLDEALRNMCVGERRTVIDINHQILIHSVWVCNSISSRIACSLNVIFFGVFKQQQNKEHCNIGLMNSCQFLINLHPVLCSLVFLAGIVQGSAVIRFKLQLVSLQNGVPEGYLFIWLEESPVQLFEALDSNQDQQVPLEEVNGNVRILGIQDTSKEKAKTHQQISREDQGQDHEDDGFKFMMTFEKISEKHLYPIGLSKAIDKTVGAVVLAKCLGQGRVLIIVKNAGQKNK
uniref:peptidylprolyl isomerase n=1 Tax=Sinocyclocheilus grahami TaxID=75366 RepID=A0A672S8I3_SINGR